jgi:hypothetical protein
MTSERPLFLERREEKKSWAEIEMLEKVRDAYFERIV